MRENLTALYGSVNNYEGRPSQTQVNRTGAIGRELGDVSKEFSGWMAKELGPINSMLVARKMAPIEVFVP